MGPLATDAATGGTIAGEQGEPGTLGGYDIRKPIGEIVAEVPEIKRYARVESVQFSNVPSSYITPNQWLQLARNINSAFEKIALSRPRAGTRKVRVIPVRPIFWRKALLPPTSMTA